MDASRPGGFSNLIGGTAPATFFGSIFGKRAAAFQGGLRSEPLFGWDQLNDVLNGCRDLPENVRVLANGDQTEPEDYQDLLRSLRQGATLFFEDVDRYSRTLSTFLARLTKELRCRTRLNLYVSSPGTSGRGLHYDCHDVFVLQIEGSKRWRIYENSDRAPVHVRKVHLTKAPGEAIKPYLDCVLRKGDVLYVPRGHWHHVEPLDEVSLHLTLGLFVPTGIDFLRWLVEECTELESMREFLPLRLAFGSDEEFAGAQQAMLAQIAEAFARRASAPSIVDEYEAFAIASLPNRVPFNLPYSLARTEIVAEPDAALVATGHTTKVFGTEDGIDLVFSNRVLKLPRNMAAVIDRALDGTPFTTNQIRRDMPAADAALVPEVLRVLLKEGLVRATREAQFPTD